MKHCVVCNCEINLQWNLEERKRALRSDAKYCSKRCWGIAYRTTEEGWAKSLLARAKKRSKAKSIEFDLDLDFILWLLREQDYKCAITDVDVSFDNDFEGRIDQYRGSLDRIDSEGGYTKNNVQIVCAQVNLMKHQSTTEELLFWSTKIVEGLS